MPGIDVVFSKRILLGVAALVISLAASASEEQADGGGDVGWRFELTPLYLWGAGIKGDTSAEGNGAPIDTDYSFFSLSNLDLAGTASLHAEKGAWGLWLDVAYVDFEDGFTVGALTTDVGIAGGIVETAVDYQVSESVEAMIGLRLVDLEADVTFTPGPSVSQGKGWLDPFVGARYNRRLADRWSVVLRGDIGGFGVSSDLVVNLNASLDYDLTDSVSFRFGYRYLKMDFQENRFVFDATARGIVAGFAFRF